MADEQKDPYYGLDFGAPRMNDEDYLHMGLGSAAEASATCPRDPGPANDPERDERLRSEILERLQQVAVVDTSHVEVRVHDADVTLDGITPDRFARRRAEDAAREVEGVTSILNRVHVQPEDAGIGGPVLTATQIEAPQEADMAEAGAPGIA